MTALMLLFLSGREKERKKNKKQKQTNKKKHIVLEKLAGTLDM